MAADRSFLSHIPEISSVSATYRSSCDAVCSARLRCIPKGAVTRSTQINAEIGHRLLQRVSAELTNMQEHQMLLGRKSAIEKLATFLLALARRSAQHHSGSYQFQLPMTRTDIADFLGMTIETVSRNVTKLKVMGVIDLPQTTYVIVRDTVRLEELAEGDEETF